MPRHFVKARVATVQVIATLPRCQMVSRAIDNDPAIANAVRKPPDQRAEIGMLSTILLHRIEAKNDVAVIAIAIRRRKRLNDATVG